MLIRRLPRLADYDEVWNAMKAFTAARDEHADDEIWLVEHRPVFTQGLAGRPEHLLAAHEVPVVKSDRGGQITYHGPGQVVAYVLLDLRRAGYFVKEYVSRVEEALIDTLVELGIPDATRKPGAPGVYVPWPRPQTTQARDSADADTSADSLPPDSPTELAKIAALGIKVHRGCTYHGLALNVAMDLAPFGWINPCGYAGLRTVDLRACRIDAGFEAVGGLLASHLERVLTATRSSPAATALPLSTGAAVE